MQRRRPGKRIASSPASASDSDSENSRDFGEDGNHSDSSSISNQQRGPLVPAHDGGGPLPQRDFRSQTELRREYSELIESCQMLRDKDGIEQDLKERMKQNINQGRELFAKIGGGPGDMYMAFLHSKMCSDMILSKSERIGSSSSGFTIEGFMNALKERHINPETNEYDWQDYVRKTAVEVSKAQKTLPSLVALLGSFDRNSILTPPEAKEKKPRATPRKKQLDVDEPTRHEEVNLSAEQRDKQNKELPEMKSKELLKKLQERIKQKSAEPVSLYDFTVQDDVAKTAETLLHVAFLARDGCVSITRNESNASTMRLDSDLLIKPETPPKKNESTEQGASENIRNQHIVSFNVRTVKAMQAACGKIPSSNTLGSKKAR